MTQSLNKDLPFWYDIPIYRSLRRPRTTFLNREPAYSSPSGISYGEAPWYMAYFDQMYGMTRDVKEKKPFYKKPAVIVIGLAGAGLLAWHLFKPKTTTSDTVDWIGDGYSSGAGFGAGEDTTANSNGEVPIIGETATTNPFVQTIQPHNPDTTIPVFEEQETPQNSAVDTFANLQFNSQGIALASPTSDGTPRYIYQDAEGKYNATTDLISAVTTTTKPKYTQEESQALIKAAQSSPASTTPIKVSGSNVSQGAKILADSIDSGGGSAVQTFNSIQQSTPAASTPAASTPAKTSTPTITVPKSTGSTALSGANSKNSAVSAFQKAQTNTNTNTQKSTNTNTQKKDNSSITLGSALNAIVSGKGLLSLFK